MFNQAIQRTDTNIHFAKRKVQTWFDDEDAIPEDENEDEVDSDEQWKHLEKSEMIQDSVE